MPNWCEGDIRFRGKKNDILKFLQEHITFVVYDYDEDTKQITNVVKPAIVTSDDWEVVLTSPFDEPERSWCHIKGTHRNFIELNYSSPISSGCTYNLDEEDPDKPTIVMFEGFRAAWGIEPDPYVQFSKDYGIDIHIFGWEQGMGFWQEIEVVGGVLTKNEATDFKEYDDFVWNAVHPTFGG